MNSITTAILSKLFETYRLIFCYDAEKSLGDEFEALTLPDVEKLEHSEANSLIAVKQRLRSELTMCIRACRSPYAPPPARPHLRPHAQACHRRSGQRFPQRERGQRLRNVNVLPAGTIESANNNHENNRVF